MEKYSGPSFHLYLVDYDKDGWVDIVLPNFHSNVVVCLRNPGMEYWHQVEGTLKEIQKGKQRSALQKLTKWRPMNVASSLYSERLRDFVIVNIDSEDKMVFAVLYEQSIGKRESIILDFFYPFESFDGKRHSTFYKEKRISIQGIPDIQLTNIYDAVILATADNPRTSHRILMLNSSFSQGKPTKSYGLKGTSRLSASSGALISGSTSSSTSTSRLCSWELCTSPGSLGQREKDRT